MKTYQCHKRVLGAPIVSCDIVDNVVIYEAADGSHAGYRVHGDFFSRGIPPAGSYLVEYEDGYVSWSPKAAFEDGYAPVAGKTLETYFRDAAAASTIDFALRATAIEGQPVTFYIHPHGKDGETLDLTARGNVLLTK